MAEVKKDAATLTAAAKAVAAKAPAKAEAAKAAEAPKAEEKKAAKPAAKKAAAKPAAAKKSAIKAVVTYQMGGKDDYTEAEFIQNAKNVWEYDLGKKPADLKNVELYVKPEEGKVYCVANGDVDNTFSFNL